MKCPLAGTSYDPVKRTLTPLCIPWPSPCQCSVPLHNLSHSCHNTFNFQIPARNRFLVCAWARCKAEHRFFFFLSEQTRSLHHDKFLSGCQITVFPCHRRLFLIYGCLEIRRISNTWSSQSSKLFDAVILRSTTRLAQNWGGSERADRELMPGGGKTPNLGTLLSCCSGKPRVWRWAEISGSVRHAWLTLITLQCHSLLTPNAH